ncbi:hypothetical protein [Zoogloea oleivorans]|jgi:hypothetical protein|uniref:hypothetical protein n=1 Tax=Zoogloea oleivorans TaxID=1552750 RepID=UPI001CA32DF7|nr:hypothetical protein [Zoogloea oleivorans]
MMTFQPAPLAKACRLPNHGPTVLVSTAQGSIHYIAGGNFFTTGEVFEVKG